jgi:hypothetical protein
MLTDLATVKSWLGISVTTYDAQLTTLIAGVDEQIKRYCARNFEVGTVIAKLLVDRQNPVVLDETPVEAILYSAVGRQQAITISHPTAQASVFVVAERNGLVKVRLVANMAATTISPAVTDTLSDLAADIVAAGWNAAVVTGFDTYPAHALLDQETGDAEADVDLVLEASLVPVILRRDQPAAGIYRLVCPTGGLYGCFPVATDPVWLRENDQAWRNGDKDNLPLVVVYTGGYQANALPAGLVLIAIKCCVDAWRTFGQAAGMKSESVGDYSYTKFDSAAIASAIGPYLGALDLYRRV